MVPPKRTVTGACSRMPTRTLCPPPPHRPVSPPQHRATASSGTHTHTCACSTHKHCACSTHTHTCAVPPAVWDGGLTRRLSRCQALHRSVPPGGVANRRQRPSQRWRTPLPFTPPSTHWIESWTQQILHCQQQIENWTQQIAALARWRSRLRSTRPQILCDNITSCRYCQLCRVASHLRSKHLPQCERESARFRS